MRDRDPTNDRIGSDPALLRCLLDVRFAPDSGLKSDIVTRRLSADTVAKVTAVPLWNSNLKQSNRDVRTLESMLRVRVKT